MSAAALEEPLLKIDGLRVEFGPADAPLAAVKGVGLEVRAGEIVGLIGESGSGKSLTCRAVMRLIGAPGRIAAGSIAFEGRDVLAMSAKELRDFRAHEAGMIYQDPFSSLNPVFRIGDQVAETLRANLGMGKDEARRHAVELLDGVGIAEPERRALSYPHELSGGMRQRVMIALATASRPRLLLADEPTTALDATVQIQILLLLRELQREMGMAVIFVTHDIGVAIEISDRVAVMYGGRIVEAGKLRDVVKNPQHPYTRGLLASTIHGAKRGVRLDTIPGAPPRLDRLPPGCSFAPRCGLADAACSQGEIRAVPLGPQRNVRCIKLVENIAAPVSV
jgi:oligopeptide/dipeptide ABC transporter ATP-binding protein